MVSPAWSRRLLQLACGKVPLSSSYSVSPSQSNILIIIPSNVKWLEAGGVQVVPIIVNGSIDQTDYFREVDIMIILMIVIMINFTITLFSLIQMFTSLNGLMIPGGPDSSIHPDAGINCSVMFTLDIFSKTCIRSSIRVTGIRPSLCRQTFGHICPLSLSVVIHHEMSLIVAGFSKASYAFFSMAMEANHAGDFFPIWGTCLGMEMLGLITTGGQEYLTRYMLYL